MTTDREIKAERMKIFWVDLGATQDDFATFLRSRGLWPNCRSGTVAQWLKGNFSPKVARVLASVDPKKRDAGWFIGMGEEVREPGENYLRTEVVSATRDHKLRKTLTAALDRCQVALATARQEIEEILTVDSARELKGKVLAGMLETDLLANRGTTTADSESFEDIEARRVGGISGGDTKTDRTGKAAKRHK